MSKADTQDLRHQLEEALERVRTLENKIGLSSTSLNTDMLFRMGLDEMYEGIQIVDRHWCYLYVNDAAAKHGRKTRDELVGRRMMDVYPDFDKTDFFKIMEEVMDNRGPRHIDNEFEYSDGRKGWFEIHIEPHPVGLLIRSMDVSKRKSIESQYFQSQKMESIGLLAGGIAHDFNNKLGVMMLFCEMVCDELSEHQGKAKGFIENLQTAVHDCATLTKQLLAFSRQQVLDVKVVNLNELIESKRYGFEKLMGESISIRFHLDKNISNVRLDPSQMDQVILNLLLNARDAMPAGGVLTIETTNVEIDHAYAQNRPEVIPGHYVLLSVSDNGTGMSQEVQARIFEPFYTTKETGRGTGLGLAAVHGVVNQFRGHIWVYSEPGIGTTFKLYLPMVRDRKDKLVDIKKEMLVTSGTETVLLVEDDDLLRQAFEEALTMAGYTVYSAANAKEARSVFSAHKDKAALLVTDVVLPGESGSIIAGEFKAAKPELKVIFVSGYTKNSIVHNGVLDTDSVLLQKPVKMAHFLDTIRKVIDGVYVKGVF